MISKKLFRIVLKFDVQCLSDSPNYFPAVKTRQIDATDCTALTRPFAMLAVCCGLCRWGGKCISGG